MITWLYYEFKPYCERKKINVLRDDFKFIEKTLLKLPSELHRRVMRHYVKIWLSTLGNNENSPQAQNLARRIANTYLREQTE